MLAPQSLLHNRYRIESLLGEGGMGAVYRAHDETLEVTVAVKENQVVTAAAQRQFAREARMLAALRHPSLPRVTDHFHITGQGQYLVMDFVEGEDLSKRLAAQTRLPEAQVLQWARDVLDALAYLHLRDIIHRDIKPANIKIGRDGRATLVDFGIAKVAGTGQTTTGARGLTPGFAPPEQYGIGSTDARSDIYSFGATLYQALTGEIPVDALARMAQQEPLKPVRAAWPEVSTRTAEAVERALAVKPEHRWATATDMQRAIEPITKESGGRAPLQPTLILPEGQATQTDVPPLPPPPPPSAPAAASQPPPMPPPPAPAARAEPGTAPRPVTAPQPARRMWIGVGLAGLAGLAGLGLVLAAAALIFGPRLLRGAAGGGSALLPASPGRIAFASDRNGNFEIYLVNPDGSGLQNLTNDTANDIMPAFSPDGSKLAFVSDRNGDPDIYVMNADGSDVLNMTNNPTTDIMPAWSPDGTTLAFASDRAEDFEIYALGPDGLTRYTTSPGDDMFPSYSSDGGLLAFASNREGSFDIYVIGPDGLTRYTNNDTYDSAPRWSPASDILLFESDRDGGLEIYLFGSDGVTRYTDTPADNWQAAWSPAGDQAVFVSNRDGNDDIFVLGPDGTQQITHDAGQNADPTWGP